MIAAVIVLSLVLAGCIAVIVWLVKRAESRTDAVASAKGEAGAAMLMLATRTAEVEELSRTVKMAEDERHAAAARADAAAKIPKQRAAALVTLVENHAAHCENGPALIRDLNVLARGLPMPEAGATADDRRDSASEAVSPRPAPIETLR